MTKVMHDSEVLKEGEQVITACGFVWREVDGVRQVFLPRRAETKKFLPGVWELPGGHVDFGEQVEVGLAREIEEEFGMKTRIGDPFSVFTYENPIKKSHSVEIVYFAQFVDDDTAITIHPEDHAEYVWATEAELAELYAGKKDADDPEYLLVQKGFRLLNDHRALDTAQV